MKYLCLKHDFSFIDHSNGWTLPNGNLDPSIFFRDSLHLIEEGNVKLAKLIINPIALTNNICFSSNTDKIKGIQIVILVKIKLQFLLLYLTLNEADFLPLSPPIHAHNCKHSPYSNNCNRDLFETHGSNYVSSTSKPVSAKTVCKPARIMSCNKPVIFSPVYKSLHTSNICISKTVRCSVSCKLVSTLISSEPVKPFVTCTPVCFSNVSMAKEFNSVNYCLVTCTEHSVNVISSTVRKSVVSYRIACSVDFDIVMETINVTLLSTYRCVSF